MNDLFDRAKHIGLRHIKDWLPFGELRGKEWFALNPTREDRNIGSFSVNTETGAFLDRATDDKGGDAVSLYSYLNGGLKQGEAAKKILEDYDAGYFPGQYKPEKQNHNNWDEWRQLKNGIAAPPILETEYYQQQWGKEIERWDLQNAKGNVIMKIVRFQPAEGKKNDRPFTLWQNGNKIKWRSKTLIDCKYPLWNLPELLLRTNDPILLCEGQKAASRAHMLISGKYICTGWYGGANAVDKTDMDPLGGRIVFFWPDADEPGRSVINKLKKYDLNLKIIIPPSGVPKGWDIADAIQEGWSPEKIINWIESAQPAYDNKMLQIYNKAMVEGKPFVKNALNKMNESQPGDSFNAWLVAEKLKDNFLYDCEQRCWYKYDEENKIWKSDIENLIVEIARATILSLFTIAAIIPEEGQRNQWVRFALRSDQIVRIRSALMLCESCPEMVVKYKHWDREKNLLNVKNGCINLDTMEFGESKKEYYFTKQANVIYDSKTDAPMWKKFLEDIFDKETEKYIQKVIGLCMTVNMNEQKFWCLYGTGSNGKGVLINLLFHIMDNYALGIDIDVIMESKADGNSPKPGIVKLIGRRLIIASENRIGQALNQGLMKQITGGDPIQARDLHCPPVEFWPECKTFIVTNHKPRIPNGGYSLWRRLKLIPFKITIPEEKQDKELTRKLKEETAGIFNWMLDGLKCYKTENLPDIGTITQATTEYRESQDILGEFINEVISTYTNRTIPASEIYTKYNEWCKENGEHTLSQRIFKLSMQERGWHYYKTGNNRFYEFIEDDEPPF